MEIIVIVNFSLADWGNLMYIYVYPYSQREEQVNKMYQALCKSSSKESWASRGDVQEVR